MRFKSLPGKWTQLCHAPPGLWWPFIHGWLRRRENQFVPCVIPGCDRLLKVPLREFYESYWFFCEYPEGRREVSYFLGKLKPHEIFYDVGGFRGAYSVAAKLKLQDKISVHVFEPLAINVEAIRRVCEFNAFNDVKINAFAVGDGSPLGGGINEEDAMLRLGDTKATTKAEFVSISLDKYIEQGASVPTVVKIDVEGFELQVLHGARQCLAQNHPRLWLEIHPKFLGAQGKSPDDALKLLRANGYSFFYFNDLSLPESKVSHHIWCE